MTREHPTFGLVIPAYNRAGRIEDALRSVVYQGFDEIVVVDDGSEDATSEVVEAFSRTHQRVRLFRQPNSGAARARNRGVSECGTDWIGFLDSDDTFDADWLDIYRQAIDEGADIVTAGHREVADATGKPLGTVLPEDLGPLFPSTRGNFTHGGTYAMRRSVFVSIGGFAPGLRAGQHTELSLRLLSTAPDHGWRVVAIDRPVMTYRVGVPGNIRGNDFARASASRYMLENHQELLRRAPRLLSNYGAIAAVGSARLGDERGMRSFARLALTADPWHLRNWVRVLIAHTLGKRYWQRGTRMTRGRSLAGRRGRDGHSPR